MVERLIWDQEAAGSSPVSPTIDTSSKFKDTIFMLLVQIQLGSVLLIDQWVDQKNFVMCLVYRAVV